MKVPVYFIVVLKLDRYLDAVQTLDNLLWRIVKVSARGRRGGMEGVGGGWEMAERGCSYRIHEQVDSEGEEGIA